MGRKKKPVTVCGTPGTSGTPVRPSEPSTDETPGDQSAPHSDTQVSGPCATSSPYTEKLNDWSQQVCSNNYSSEDSTLLRTINYESDPEIELSDSSDEEIGPHTSWTGITLNPKRKVTTTLLDYNVKYGDIEDPNQILTYCNKITTLADSIITILHLKKSLTRENKKLIEGNCEEIKNFINEMIYVKEGRITKKWRQDRIASEANRTSKKIAISTAIDYAIEKNMSNLKNSISDTIKAEVSAALQQVRSDDICVTPPAPATSFGTNLPSMSRNYAAVVSSVETNLSERPPQPSSIKSSFKPAIIVTAPNAANKEETLQLLKAKCPPKDITCAPTKIIPTSSNKLRLIFDNEKEQVEALKRMQGSNELHVAAAPRLMPMIALKGIPADCASDDLVSIIGRQNPDIGLNLLNHDSKLELAFTGKNKNPKLYNAYFKTTPDIWRIAINSVRLNIDFNRVHVSDFIPLLHCFRCLSFGHTSRNCKFQNPICSFCAEPGHSYASCQARIGGGVSPCCHNCKTGKKEDTAHSATSNLCPIKSIQVKRTLEKISYEL